MQGLIDFINNFANEIKIAAGVFIGLVAIIFIGLHVVKAIAASKKSKMNDVMKHIGFAILVALIASVGIAGVIGLLNMLRPDQSILPGDDNPVLNGAPAVIQHIPNYQPALADIG